MLLSRARWGDLIRAHDWDAMDDFESRDLVTIERDGIDNVCVRKADADDCVWFIPGLSEIGIGAI
jgi:hypothetical protein